MAESNAYGELKLFCGTATPALGEEIAAYLQIPQGRVNVTRFADGEIYVRFEENARGVDAFVLQSTCHPVNEHLMELLIMVDALRRASAGRITAVTPYYGYARKDKKDAPREPITGRLVADLLMTAGAHRMLAVDLHAGQIEGFFNIPVDHLRAMPLFADYVRDKGLSNAEVRIAAGPNPASVHAAAQNIKQYEKLEAAAATGTASTGMAVTGMSGTTEAK